MQEGCCQKHGCHKCKFKAYGTMTLNSDLNVINKDSSMGIDVPFKEYIQKCISSCILRVNHGCEMNQKVVQHSKNENISMAKAFKEP